MKIYSKEALLWGGLYELISTPFAYTASYNLGGILLVVFILGMFLLFFNKTPRFIRYILDSYPKFAYYICSFGWLPYFRIFILVAGVFMAGIFMPEDKTVELSSQVIGYVLSWGLPLSLLIAFIHSLTTKLYGKSNE